MMRIIRWFLYSAAIGSVVLIFFPASVPFRAQILKRIRGTKPTKLEREVSALSDKLGCRVSKLESRVQRIHTDHA